MAPEKAEKKEKKEKKERKDRDKHSSEDGVRKPKKNKKEKKDKKERLKEAVAANETAVINELDARLQADAASQAKALPSRSLGAAMDEDDEPDATAAGTDTKPPALIGALVPFAKPLADDKLQKKVLKSVRKCKTLAPPIATTPRPLHAVILGAPPPDSRPSLHSETAWAGCC